MKYKCLWELTTDRSNEKVSLITRDQVIPVDLVDFQINWSRTDHNIIWDWLNDFPPKFKIIPCLLICSSHWLRFDLIWQNAVSLHLLLMGWEGPHPSWGMTPNSTGMEVLLSNPWTGLCCTRNRFCKMDVLKCEPLNSGQCCAQGKSWAKKVLHRPEVTMRTDSYKRPQTREKVTFWVHLQLFVSFLLIIIWSTELNLYILIPLVCRQALLAILDSWESWD